jgi:hypothetical protein
MAIDFPNSPTSGQIFTSGDKSWIWDGTVWKAYGASLSPTVLKVDSTNTRVGINNQSPAYTLDVNGTVEATQFIQGTDYLTPYTGFRNAIINGDFRINQRAWSSSTATASYGFDRFSQINSGGTVTMSSQSFTVGSPAATGYEATNFCRMVTASQSGTGHFAILRQHIEDVRTLANSTITVSFWAKASSGTPKVAVEVVQSFGSGGSPSADVNTYIAQVTLSTSWARYSVTGTVPNINGKTIGTTANTSAFIAHLWVSAGSDFNSRTGSMGIQNTTIDFWGVQVERGSVATPFEQRPIQTELALCQRYYHRHYSGDGNMKRCVVAQAYTYWTQEFFHPVEMRASPTVTIYNSALTAGNYDPDGGGVSNAVTARADKRGFAFYSTVTRNGEFWYTASAEF